MNVFSRSILGNGSGATRGGIKGGLPYERPPRGKVLIWFLEKHAGRGTIKFLIRNGDRE